MVGAIDAINQRVGRDCVHWASSVSIDDALRGTPQQRRTPAYTTGINQVLKVWR